MYVFSLVKHFVGLTLTSKIIRYLYVIFYLQVSLQHWQHHQNQYRWPYNWHFVISSSTSQEYFSSIPFQKCVSLFWTQQNIWAIQLHAIDGLLLHISCSCSLFSHYLFLPCHLQARLPLSWQFVSWLWLPCLSLLWMLCRATTDWVSICQLGSRPGTSCQSVWGRWLL